MQKRITVPNQSFQDSHESWNAREKKNAYIKKEIDGVVHHIPIMEHLHKLAAQLPPTYQNGRRMVHVDEMRWRFMKGKTKLESMALVKQYCSDVIEAYNKAVEKHNNENQPETTEQ